MPLNYYADIILPVPLPRLFTYEVPAEFKDSLTRGMRVVVPFGKKKLHSGIVYTLHNNNPEAYETKEILSVIDTSALVLDQQLSLWQWIADYYQCTLGEVYKAALPSGLKLESETQIYINQEFEAEEPMSEKAQMILDFLSGKKKSTINDINNITGLKNSYPIIQKLIDLEAVYINEQLTGSYKPRTEFFISLHPSQKQKEQLKQTFERLERAPKQLEGIMQFLQLAGGVANALKGHEVLRKDIMAAMENATAAIGELIRKEILAQRKKPVDRLDFSSIDTIEKKSLSQEQDDALKGIKKGFSENKPVLLHGVTSSGKTELYIHLIAETLKHGKQALYLLPEIALTTQITSRLKAHFGNQLGIYHSKFSDEERVEVWNNLLTQKNYKVILGVRSSIFLPFTNLGLIIVDEEHEHSFKQFDPAPRYHARDVALILARNFKANILLGTATPSIESYYNALNGKFHLVELNTRFEGLQLPEILIVNTREARRKKMMVSHFTPELIEFMKKALDNKEQVILFQNRRGFAPFLECDACAWIPRCRHCDVSMTYHKHINQLICHYCGYSVTNYTTCQACGSPALQLKGFGTQKIEEEIKNIFPASTVERMDYDTTRSKKGYENIITRFEQGKLDILVGTQMVTKGLDFDRVSLVGILNADNMLNNPDFRAFERSFQMIAQVSGRAGRKNKRGTVILQTSDPEHPVIRQVQINDFASFFLQQIQEREEFRYPPFYRLVNLTLKHKNQNTNLKAATELAKQLGNIFGNRVLGPQVPPITKIQDLHLQRILLKLEREASPVKAKSLMRECINNILSQDRWRHVTIVIDVDPM